MTFGERIVYFREKRGLSQKALAEQIGITANRLYFYEKDKRQPDVALIKAIAKALSISGDDLLGTEWATEKAPAPEGTEAVSMEQSNRLYDALVAAGLIVDDDLAAQDFQFLGHICDLITDWFSGKHPE